MPRLTAAFVFLFLVSIATTSIRADQTMYWSDRGANTIRQGQLDASNIDVLVSGLGEARGVDVDLVNGYIYWADNGNDKIQRSGLDGSNVEDLVTTGLNFPAGVAVDPYNKKLYWADARNGKIQQSDLDGSNVVDLITEVTGPYFITLDLIHEQIYWTDQSSQPRKIQRANLDGSNVEDLVLDLGLPRGIALDLVHDKMYFADRNSDVIQRANLDGSNVETLVRITSAGGVSAPHGVALDIEREHVYWVDNGTVKIQRADFDGSNVVDLLTTPSPELSRPWQIVLDLEIERCDFNRSGTCDDVDLDLLSAEMALGTNKALFNLDTSDNAVNAVDHRAWLDLASVLPGDANLDGAVDAADFDVWNANRFTADVGWAKGDFDGDGVADGADFNIWNVHNGMANIPTVPEPAAFSLLMLGLILLRRRIGKPQNR